MLTKKLNLIVEDALPDVLEAHGIQNITAPTSMVFFDTNPVMSVKQSHTKDHEIPQYRFVISNGNFTLDVEAVYHCGWSVNKIRTMQNDSDQGLIIDLLNNLKNPESVAIRQQRGYWLDTPLSKMSHACKSDLLALCAARRVSNDLDAKSVSPNNNFMTVQWLTNNECVCAMVSYYFELYVQEKRLGDESIHMPPGVAHHGRNKLFANQGSFEQPVYDVADIEFFTQLSKELETEILIQSTFPEARHILIINGCDSKVLSNKLLKDGKALSESKVVDNVANQFVFKKNEFSLFKNGFIVDTYKHNNIPPEVTQVMREQIGDLILDCKETYITEQSVTPDEIDYFESDLYEVSTAAYMLMEATDGNIDLPAELLTEYIVSHSVPSIRGFNLVACDLFPQLYEFFDIDGNLVDSFMSEADLSEEQLREYRKLQSDRDDSNAIVSNEEILDHIFNPHNYMDDAEVYDGIYDFVRGLISTRVIKDK